MLFRSIKNKIYSDLRDGLERVTLGEIEERDGITYKIGKYEPYIGIVEEIGGKRGYNVAATICDFFELNNIFPGKSFLNRI